MKNPFAKYDRTTDTHEELARAWKKFIQQINETKTMMTELAQDSKTNEDNQPVT